MNATVAIWADARRDALTPTEREPERQGTRWDIVYARHALHHRRMSWEYLRAAQDPSSRPEWRAKDIDEAKRSREAAWFYLRHAMQVREALAPYHERNAA